MRLRDEKKAGALLLAALLLTGCGGAADTASNVETGTAADAATTAAADTAAGTWELVSMTYNGMTVGKEDLEEMGTAMTLDLLEDGTGTMDYDGTVYDLTWDDKQHYHGRCGRFLYVGGWCADSGKCRYRDGI